MLREKLPSLSVADLQSLTGAELVVPAPVADLIVRSSDLTPVYICDYIRTPIGRFGGALSPVRTDDLGAIPCAPSWPAIQAWTGEAVTT